MNIRKLILVIILLSACSDLEYYYQQPVNPPIGIKLNAAGNDFHLIFRSENRNNPRFRGFLIFIHPNRDELIQMNSIDDADYELNENTDGIHYNIGIDNLVNVLFSNQENFDTSIYITRLPKDNLTTGSWLTIRTFLYDEKYGIILSPPGNSVLIE